MSKILEIAWSHLLTKCHPLRSKPEERGKNVCAKTFAWVFWSPKIFFPEVEFMGQLNFFLAPIVFFLCCSTYFPCFAIVSIVKSLIFVPKNIWKSQNKFLDKMFKGNCETKIVLKTIKNVSPLDFVIVISFRFAFIN